MMSTGGKGFGEHPQFADMARRGGMERVHMGGKRGKQGGYQANRQPMVHPPAPSQPPPPSIPKQSTPMMPPVQSSPPPHGMPTPPQVVIISSPSTVSNPTPPQLSHSQPQPPTAPHQHHHPLPHHHHPPHHHNKPHHGPSKSHGMHSRNVPRHAQRVRGMDPSALIPALMMQRMKDDPVNPYRPSPFHPLSSSFTLVIKDIPPTTTLPALRELFEKYGHINRVWFDSDNGYVTYKTEKQAEAGLRAVQTIEGQELRVSPCDYSAAPFKFQLGDQRYWRCFVCHNTNRSTDEHCNTYRCGYLKTLSDQQWADNQAEDNSGMKPGVALAKERWDIVGQYQKMLDERSPESEPDKTAEGDKAQGDQGEDDSDEPHCIVVSNLPPQLKNQEVAQVFSRYGQIVSLYLASVMDQDTQEAQVVYNDLMSVELALEYENGKLLTTDGEDGKEYRVRAHRSILPFIVAVIPESPWCQPGDKEACDSLKQSASMVFGHYGWIRNVEVNHNAIYISYCSLRSVLQAISNMNQRPFRDLLVSVHLKQEGSKWPCVKCRIVNPAETDHCCDCKDKKPDFAAMDLPSRWKESGRPAAAPYPTAIPIPHPHQQHSPAQIVLFPLQHQQLQHQQLQHQQLQLQQIQIQPPQVAPPASHPQPPPPPPQHPPPQHPPPQQHQPPQHQSPPHLPPTTPPSHPAPKTPTSPSVVDIISRAATRPPQTVTPPTEAPPPPPRQAGNNGNIMDILLESGLSPLQLQNMLHSDQPTPPPLPQQQQQQQQPQPPAPPAPPAPPTPPTQHLPAVKCLNCSSTEGLMVCSQCRQAYFCSEMCQKAKWPDHRQVCKKYSSSPSSNAAPTPPSHPYPVPPQHQQFSNGTGQ